MSFTEIRESVDPQHAVLHVALMRDTLEKLRAAECFERKQALLAVLGYPRPEDERELDIIVRTLRKSAYPSRSGGIA